MFIAAATETETEKERERTKPKKTELCVTELDKIKADRPTDASHSDPTGVRKRVNLMRFSVAVRMAVGMTVSMTVRLAVGMTIRVHAVSIRF